MNPDLVRLILIVFGVLLVVGIYLWDRYKHAGPSRRMVRRRPVEIAPDETAIETRREVRAEPTIDDVTESIPEMRADEPHDEPSEAAQGRRMASARDPEPAELGEWVEATRDADPQFSMDLNFDAHDDGDYLTTDPALRDDVERKIVVINLVARGGTFAGPAIAKACDAVGLVLGEMSIYHRRVNNGGRVLFSMASMVEPGSFPADSMAGFSTPGLSIFTQLPGVLDGVEIFEAMLSTANRLASLLNGELQDERHNKFTRQMEKHLRDAIIEHRRQITLARSRH
jgi:cell division protein ZipA